LSSLLHRSNIAIRPAALGALLLLSALTSTANDDRWYQIEVIAFKRLDVALPAANQLPDPAPFPSDIIAIAPHREADITPLRLEQALYLMAKTDTPGLSQTASVSETDQNQYRFFDQATGLRNRALIAALKAANAKATAPSANNAMAALLDQQKTAILDAITSESSAFRAVANQDLALGQVARSIRRSSLYQLLLHQSWTQPINEETTSILLQGGAQYGPSFELEGTIALRRSRYLHLETDLYLTQFQATLGKAESEDLTLVAAQYPELVAAAKRGAQSTPAHRYHMIETRRLRSNEAHYIDHPAFGLILEIRPASEAL